jgi:WD40 repeat protein
LEYALTTLLNGVLVSGSQYKMIKIWNPNDVTFKRTSNVHTRWATSLTTLPNGNMNNVAII